MRIIWTEAGGYRVATYRKLNILHRAFGHGAIDIMLFIAIITCIGITGYGTRTT